MRQIFRHAIPVLACLAAAFPNGAPLAADVKHPDPEDGSVSDGAYGNPYFALTYPLPKGWIEGLEGAAPSTSGYYVLRTLRPQGDLTATLLIAAQDTFFAPTPTRDAAHMVEGLRQATARIEDMKIDREPEETMVAGRRFVRLDYSGVGLHRALLATDSRCHVILFVITSADPNQIEDLVHSLDRLTAPAAPPAAATEQASSSSDPVCIKDYASEQTLVHRVNPAPVGPNFTPIPVRITIGTDGHVKHVHVIHAVPEQRSNIERALAQWEFKPHQVDAHPVEVETGLLLEFKPTGQ
jgi:hypothetical protein